MILIVFYVRELFILFKWKCVFLWKFRFVLMNKDELLLLNRIGIYKISVLENLFKK